MTESFGKQSGQGRVTGLTSFETPTLEMIAKRRLQLWAMTLALLVSTVAILSLVLFWDNPEISFTAARGIVYLGVVVLVALFGAYAIGKELDLRALTEELMDERVLAAALTNSLREANALIESARIDGCTHLRILVSIVVPLSRAPLFTVGFLAFLHAWNSLQWPLVVTQTPRWRPISVGLVKFITEAGPETQLRLAGAVIALLPIMLIYFVAQKQITEAITRTGLKE